MAAIPFLMANLVLQLEAATLPVSPFNLAKAPSNINGARTPESLITF